MDLRDLVALLHRGGRDLRTVRLVGTTRTDHEAVANAMERWRRERHDNAVVMRAYARDPAIERPRFEEQQTRLWVERPDKAREEVAGRDARYGVAVGSTWWLWVEGQGAMTNNGAANHHAGIGDGFRLFLEPAPLLPGFDFEVLGEVEQAGRRAARVRARARPSGDEGRLFGRLPAGCEECELAVDVEHGTLLRLVALLDGEPGVDTRIEEIAYDEPIPPETFEFVAPPGEEIEDVTLRRDLRLPIDVVAERASFTVFVADGLDGEWRLHARHLPQRRGQPHEHVHLHYHRADATHNFGINEQPADAEPFFTTGREPETVERGGRTLKVVRPTESFPLGSVRLTVEGTSIEVTSDNLPVERLLELADGLKPLP
ncbi:MAG TPA: hypothetical protein VH538_02190 [Gaiellaceae bacterium]